jgi:hypothetical protein
MDSLSAVGLGTNIVNMIELTSRIFNALLQYCHCVKRAPLKSKEIRDELLVLSDILKELDLITGDTNERYTDHQGVAALKKSLDECFGLLKEMDERVTVENADIIRRIKWPFNEKENEDYLH